MIVEGGYKRLSILARTVIEGSGQSVTSTAAARFGSDVTEDVDSHGTQELDLVDIDAEGGFELRAESSGCTITIKRVRGKQP